MKWHTVQGNTNGAASTILENLEICNKGNGIYFVRATSWFVWYFCAQRSRVPQAWTDDRGLWESLEEDDGGVCPSWKSKIVSLRYRLSLSVVTRFHLNSLPVFCVRQALSDALVSLQMVYPRRNLSADQWRNAQLLSLISAPSTMLNPAQSDTVRTHYTTLIFYYKTFITIVWDKETLGKNV